MFVRLALADGFFGYGRLLEPPSIAFYDHKTTDPDSDLDRIASRPVLFKIAVNLLALNAWEIIGWRALEEHMTQPLVQFRQDVGDFRRCTIFDTAGNKRSAEPQECVGLERAAVWEQDSVEERLLDAFLGRPNAAMEHLKVRLR
ncbi:immunity 26/phosphotriesterase HocA family protein [Cystobacter fuscus]|uniref:immunity 26/phosphotriesterase HocA family protein n=1 Tax=Cystobacter fuscus TaxID=43 RepID=UPI0037BF561B